MYDTFVLNNYIRLRKENGDRDFCYQMSLLSLMDHISTRKFRSLADAQEFQAFWLYARTQIEFTQMLEESYQLTRVKRKKTDNVRLFPVG